MAKIIPNDFIKGITGRVCTHSDSYYSMNPCSGKIHTGKICNPYTGPSTESQLSVQNRFKVRAAASTDWLNTNKPTDDAPKGTALYQEAEKLKKELQLSNIRQVLHLYMDKDTNVIKLPSEGGKMNTSDSSVDKVTITTAVNDENMGSVKGGGTYAKGTSVTLTAVPSEGFSLEKWSDGTTLNPRTITASEDATYTAEFQIGTGKGEV